MLNSTKVWPNTVKIIACVKFSSSFFINLLTIIRACGGTQSRIRAIKLWNQVAPMNRPTITFNRMIRKPYCWRISSWTTPHTSVTFTMSRQRACPPSNTGVIISTRANFLWERTRTIPPKKAGTPYRKPV